jgi:hypothetical protein
MISALKEIESPFSNQIHESVFLGDSTRPQVRPEVFQGFRLTNSAKRVASDRFDDVHDLECDPPIGLDPEAQVFSEFVLKEDASL